ncbi:MAG: ATP-binding protein [Methanomicrobia archaeon]|nr:ATP-binding protein [Methanomicrobia archaeon]
MTERFELTVEAKAEQLARIGEFITDAMRAFGLDDRKSFQVQLAVDEACANIINYGYADAETVGMIELVCCKKGEDIVVVISDVGTPFDPTTAQPPDLTANWEERAIGGLGIHFMKTLVDELAYEYRDGKNVLTMLVKRHDRT